MSEPDGYVPTLREYAELIVWLCDRDPVSAEEVPVELRRRLVDAQARVAWHRVSIALMTEELVGSSARPCDGHPNIAATHYVVRPLEAGNAWMCDACVANYNNIRGDSRVMPAPVPVDAAQGGPDG